MRIAPKEVTMPPTTLFSNRDEIARAADAPMSDATTLTSESPVRSASIGSRAFSMFNDLPDGALRASRGVHMSARVFVALAAAATFGVYALAREGKKAVPAVTEQPAQAEQMEQAAPPELAPILPAPAANEAAIKDVTPAPSAITPEPAAKSAPVVVKNRKSSQNPWDMPEPARATIRVPSVATPVEVPAPAEPVVETPVSPAPAPDVPAAPAPEAPAPMPSVESPAPAPAPVAPVPPPAQPAAPVPAN
jgi:hypothetical protein